MDIKPRIEITPENLYGYIDDIEINYTTKKDTFLGTFNSKTLNLKLVGIEENSIPAEIGLKIGIDDEEPKKISNFIVMSYKYDKDTKTATIKGNDYRIKFDKYYDLELTYPLDLGQLAGAICGAVNVNLKDINFDNHNFIMEKPKVDNKYTYAEIIGMIASAMGGIAFINNNDELEFKKMQYSDLIIENIFEQSVEGEKIGPINYLELAREPINDIVKIEDLSSIETYGKTAIKIVNNYLIDDNRENAIQTIFDNILNFEFYPANINTYQGYKVEPFDIIKIGDNNILITNINIKYPLMFNGFVGSEQLSKTESRHNIAKGIEKRIIDAEAKVDKIEGNITLVVQEQTVQADNIEKIENDAKVTETKISEIVQNVNSITNSINFSGGGNKVKNSVGLYGSDLYTITNTGTETGVATFGEVAELKSVTASGAMVYACNKKIEHGEIELIEGQQYALTFKYSNVEGNRLRFVFKNTVEEILVDTLEEENLKEITYTFIASGNVSYYFECSYLDDTKAGFYTDLIIKEGDLRSNWEPASEEFMGTTFSIYYNGIEITSENSNIKTIINNLGFSVVDKNNISNIILTMNNLRVLLTNTEINGNLKIEDFLWQQQVIENDTCLFLI